MQTTPKAGAFILLTGLFLSCHPYYHISQSARRQYALSDTIATDSSIYNLYRPYKLQLDSEMNVVIGHSIKALTKENDAPETLLGNFFSDALLYEARKIDPAVDFGMPSTKGGLRKEIGAGPIQLRNVYELMPFENELLIFKISGQDVMSLLDFIAATGGQPVAGIQLKIKAGKPTEVLIGGKPFDSSRAYTVVTSDYIAGGGDRVTSFMDPLEKKLTGQKIRDLLISYIKEQQNKGQAITASLDRRITVEK